MRGAIIIAACLATMANAQVCAQPSVPAQGTVVDLREATSHFAELFENTCYRHRHTLTKLRTEPPTPEWQRLLGAYPVREENQGSNTLVEWGRWSRGVPYTVALVVFDTNPSITNCIVFTTHMYKSTLYEALSRIRDLKILKEVEEDNKKMAAIGSDSERNLRVVCTTPLEDQLYNGQCALWLDSEAGS